MADLIIPPLIPVSREQRERTLGQQAHIFWLTGLSGSGKSTLAGLLETKLQERGHKTMLLDGDVLRIGLNSDLGFSDEDRTENIRRVGEVNQLFFEAGLIVINAFISPFEADRAFVRSRVPSHGFSEVFIKADLTVCESRDTKGMYQKARSGEIALFTGVSSPYEAPAFPELVIETGSQTIEAALEMLLAYAITKVQ